MEELQLADTWDVLKRRKKSFFAIVGVLSLLSVFIAAGWSNYRSTATVEIAQSEIPDAMAVPAGMPAANLLESLADMRISRLQQKVLATSSLVEIITKLNLYEKVRQTKPIAEIANDMRKKIQIDLVGTSLANPASAQKVSADQLSAIAFKISFDYGSPLLAQQTTNEIVSRFLDEDLQERRRQAKETAAFLDSQIKIADASLKEQEKQIAAFRTEHGDVRPEALAFNQQVATNAANSLQNLEGQMAANLGTQEVLRGQLASVNPYIRLSGSDSPLTTPAIQLKTLRTEYAALTTKYGPEHPDVLRAKRQIAALEAQVGKSGETSETIVKDADNPAYMQIAAQLRAAEEQYKALIQQKKYLESQQLKYQRAVVENPSVEQRMAELTRDYDNAQAHYRDLKAKKMAADMAATIEEGSSGQRLVVIEPPNMPFQTQPSRLLFAAAGIFLSVFAGAAFVIGLQLLKRSVVGAHHLESLTGVAPLIVIPQIAIQADTAKKAAHLPRWIALAAAAFVLLLIVVSYTVMPLDVLGSVLARRLGF